MSAHNDLDAAVLKAQDEYGQALADNMALTQQVAALEKQLDALNPKPTQTVSIGAWAEMGGDGKSTLAEQQQFDTLSKQKMAASMQYGPFKNADGSAFKFLFCNEIYNAGRWPHVAWGAGAVMPDVAAGKSDAVLTQSAKNVAAVAKGRRFQLRPWWEMNGTWMKWNASFYGNDPSVYVKAWRRMAGIFRAEAPDVELVWSPDWQSVPNQAWNKMGQYYPGDEFVDRIGVSAYNPYIANSQPWRTFAQIVAEFEAFAAGRPVMMSEGSSIDDPQNAQRKGQWITETAAYLKANPQWKEFLWFHRPPVTKEANKDYRVDSSPASLAAWQKLCADPYFQGA